ncbi:hypothetical protein OKA04_05725 [Luteolibacter flavescens]|uniref:RRM domain-containing protein n=1 Tax=Luteolibacter flavescens TaxID=1859460 RepID=A0ABT3FKZ0_9BACT|nr:hypothetical protein [Luteolibacter flavescens]MCW1884221.1 hypothetical protein [Luteolibacter flavescens]
MSPHSQFPTASAALLIALLALTSCKPGQKGTAVETAEKPAVSAEEITETPPAPESDAYLILPGDYSQATTVADLEARFGKENVRRETAPELRVVLYPEDPTRRAFVTFHDGEALEDLAGITVTDPGSKWRGKHGVHIGMTIAKLQSLNRKPFFFWVDDADQHSRAHDGWSPALDDDDGTLGELDVAEGEHLYFDVLLGPTDPAVVRAIPGLPNGEQISSADPRYRELREVIVVTGIGASSSLDDEW